MRTALSTHTTYIPAACAMALAMQGPAMAQHISVNFGAERNDSAVSDAGKNSGAIPTDGALWNNTTDGAGTAMDLIDSTGATTNAGVAYTSATSWYSASPGATETSENGDLTRGYLDDGQTTEGVSWDVSMNSPYLLNDIYVMVASGQGNPFNSLPIRINGTLYIGDGAGGTTLASRTGETWSAEAFSTADTLVEGTNYIMVADQPGVNVQGIPRQGSNRSSIAGLQVENAYSGTLSYWDVNGAAAGAGDTGDGSLDGTWGSDAFWSDSAIGDAATTAWTPGTAAVFSAGSDGLNEHTITVDGTQTPDAIWVQEGGITLSGGTIDLSAGMGLLRDDDFGLLIDSAVVANDLTTFGYIELNGDLTISGNLTASGDLFIADSFTAGSLSGDALITAPAIDVVLGGTEDGLFAGQFLPEMGSTLEKTGTNTQSLGSGSPEFFDSVTIGGGTLQLGPGFLDASLSGAGNLEKTFDGELVLTQESNPAFSGKVIVSGGVLRFPADATLGPAPGAPTADAITLAGGQLSGGTEVDTADLLLPANRGITLAGGNSGFSTDIGSTTTVDGPIVGEGNLRSLGGGSVVLNGDVDTTGEVYVDGNSSIALNGNSVNFPLGYKGLAGSGSIDAGTVELGDIELGNSTSQAHELTLTDGVVNVANDVRIGHWGSETSTLNVSGGTLNLTGTVTSPTNEGESNLMLGIDGTGILNLSGGTINTPSLVLDGRGGTDGVDTLSITGGALNIGEWGIRYGNNDGSTTLIELGGGTLGATADWSSSVTMTLTGTNGDISLNGGSNAILLTGQLTGTGGLSVDGGTVVLGGETSDYTGGTVVNGGLLRIAGAGIGTSAVTVNDGGTIGAGGAETGAGTVETLDLQNGSASAFRLSFASPDMLTVTAADGLSVTGSHTISALPSGKLLPGDEFMLIDYEGSIGGAGFGGLSVEPLPNPHFAISLVDNTDNTSVDLKVDSVDSITWTGAVDGVWDVDSTGNWETDSDMMSSNFYDFDLVTFGDGTGSTNITVSGPVSPAEVVFLNDTDTFTLAGDGISGGGELAVSGGGTVILTNDNEYTGQTLVTSGTLQIGDGTTGSISASSTIVNDDTLIINLPDGATFPNTIDGTGVTHFVGGGDLDFTGKMIGAGTLSVETEGTTNFTNSGQNGDFVITDGTSLINGGAWTTSFFGDGVRSVTVEDGATIINETHGFGGLGTALYQPSITVQTGGRWILAGEQYLSANNLTLDGGTIEVESDEDLRMQGGTCLVNATDGGSVIEGGGPVRLFGAVSFDVADGAAAGDLQFNTPITESGELRSLTKSGDGTLVLNAAASHTGETFVDAGMLQLTETGALTGTSLVQIAAGAEVDASAAGLALGAGQAVGGDGTLTGSATLTGGAVSPGDVAGSLTVTGDVAFGEGSSYSWQIVDWTGAAGTGYDTLVADTLTFSATEAAPFTVFVGEDMLANFDGSDASFTLATAANGISGFDPLAVAVDASEFTSGFGTWEVSVSGNDLVLDFTAGDDPYLTWENANGIAGAGPTVDSDGDGVDNCIEFVVGGDPNGTDSNGLLPTATTDETYLTFTFRRTDESAFYQPFVEYGSDLAGWTAAADGVDGVIITETDDGFGAGIDQVDVQIPRALATGSSLFARLSVEIP